MYPRNAASPPRIAVGAVIQISDGAVQTSGVSVAVRPNGGSETAGGGQIAYGASSGIVYYTPTQAETDYTDFVITAYKTGCIPVAVTVITTAESTAGKVSIGSSQSYNNTGQAANLPANVQAYGGSNGTFSGGRPEVNATHIGGQAVSLSTDNRLQVDVVEWNDVPLATTDKLNVLYADWLDGGRLDVILDTIAGDVENLDGAAMRGTDGANTSTPLDAAGVRAAVGLAAANLDAQLAAIPTNPMLATEDGSSFTAIPWNSSWDAEVESEVNDALVALHLDHLLAVDYDPASKPGTATALFNELIESNAGVSRYTAAALAQAPGGEASVNVTVSATSVAATTLATSGKLTLRRDNDNSFQLTGLGSLAGRSKLWFCLKRRLTDTDDEAILLAEENDGVTYIEGAAAGSSAGVTITVDDEDAGDVTITIDDDVMTQLVARSNLLYQVKVDDTELLDQTDTDVRCDVIDAVIRSVT